MEPATTAMIASAIMQGLGAWLGGGDQERQPFKGGVDPQTLLGTAMTGIERLQGGMAGPASKPIQLRNSAVQSINPINVPGLPFQIGGGFGMDPALKDSTLLNYAQPDFAGMDIFQNRPMGDVRRRTPSSSGGRGTSPKERK